MAFIAAGERLHLEATGTKVNLCNDPIHRLMYYLNCIETISSFDFGHLSDFKNYGIYNTSVWEEVISTASVFNPEKMLSLNFFILDDELESNNEFYKITHEQALAMSNGIITIGAYRGKITKNMKCRIIWLSENYYIPMQNAKAKLRRLLEHKTETKPTSTACNIG